MERLLRTGLHHKQYMEQVGGCMLRGLTMPPGRARRVRKPPGTWCCQPLPAYDQHIPVRVGVVFLHNKVALCCISLAGCPG